MKKRVFGFLAAIVVALTVTAATATPATATSLANPVGTWLLTVSVSVNPAPHQVIFEFHADHQLIGRQAPGFPNLSAHGLWNGDYGGKFTFSVHHDGVKDENGNVLALPVNALHIGRLSHHNNHFDSHAFAYSIMPDESWLGPITVSISAARCDSC